MGDYFKTYIEPHNGELDEQIISVISSHEEWYGKLEITDFLHSTMYDILDNDGNLVGFFGNSRWNNGGEPQCVLCYAFVYPEYRGLGLFNKMVKYTIEHNNEAKTIVIGAMDNNELANTIYSRKFPISEHDDTDNSTWYMIKDRRAKNG